MPPEIGLNRGTFSASCLGYPKGLVDIVLLACFSPNLTPPKVPPDMTVNFLVAPALTVEGLSAVVVVVGAAAGVGAGYVAAPTAGGFTVDAGPLLKLPTSLNCGGLDGTSV